MRDECGRVGIGSNVVPSICAWRIECREQEGDKVRSSRGVKIEDATCRLTFVEKRFDGESKLDLIYF